MSKIICVNIQKGGCGKTTTVQALGEMLGKSGKKVLLIDTDAQCNLSSASGIDVTELNYSLYELLKNECKLVDAICKTKYYDIIPGSLALCTADNEFNKTGKEFLLKEKLESVKDVYDYIIVDTPPALNVLNIMSLTASDFTLIPLEPSDFALQGIAQLYETIKTVKQYCNQNIEILGMLLVKYDDRTNINKSILNGIDAMADSMETIIFNTQIRECTRIKEAQLNQVPLIDYKGKTDKKNEENIAVADYNTFLKELIKIVKESER